MRKLKKNQTKCEYRKHKYDVTKPKRCKTFATTLVYSDKKKKVLKCCEKHRDIVLEEGRPEYEINCENCGCGLPVN